jgi:hypothetical protein
MRKSEKLSVSSRQTILILTRRSMNGISGTSTKLLPRKKAAGGVYRRLGP